MHFRTNPTEQEDFEVKNAALTNKFHVNDNITGATFFFFFLLICTDMKANDRLFDYSQLTALSTFMPTSALTLLRFYELCCLNPGVGRLGGT